MSDASADPNRDPRTAHERRRAAANPDVRQEPEHVAYHSVILSLIAALGLSGILVLATTLVLQHKVRARRPEGLPRPDTAHQGPDKVARVFQTQILDEMPATQVKRDKLRKLEQYGWVSRSHDIVRIPIDSAIDIVLGEQTAPPPGGPTETPSHPRKP